MTIAVKVRKGLQFSPFPWQSRNVACSVVFCFDLKTKIVKSMDQDQTDPLQQFFHGSKLIPGIIYSIKSLLVLNIFCKDIHICTHIYYMTTRVKT